jgi:hypothetical protein
MAARAADGPAVLSPLRRTFLHRSQHALERIARTADEDSLARALEAPTDLGTLARILVDAEVAGAAVQGIEPLAPLIARNAGHRAELVQAAGGMLASQEVAELLAISRQAVDKRRRGGGLLAVRQGGDWRYPRCQLDRHEVVAGLPELLAALAQPDPWVALDFLLAPDMALEGASPLEALRRGGPWRERAIRVARAAAGDGFA